MTQAELKTEVFPNPDSVARAAAGVIAQDARTAVAARGQFLFAVSGGRTPWQMLRDLAKEEVPWERVQIFQVDERIAPTGDPDRNLTHLRASLLSHAPLRSEQIHALPVEDSDLAAAVRNYASVLNEFAGVPPILDLVHLGMGADGHTASLIPGDPVLHVTDADVGLTEMYQQRRRMTLTFPLLHRARRVLWVVTGADKVAMLTRLQPGDRSIPSGIIRRANALVLADRAAVGGNEFH